MSNVLDHEKQHQILALGRLGWSLRRIQHATGVRRETISGYLKAAAIPIRGHGRRPRVWPPAKPATPAAVSTDADRSRSGEITPVGETRDEAKPATPPEVPPVARGRVPDASRRSVVAPPAGRPAGAVGSPRSDGVDETVRADVHPAGTSGAADGEDGRVYSAADAGIRPPRAVRQSFYTAPPPDVSPANLMRVEIVISPTGDVVSARVVGRPASYAEGMTLSALKGDKFAPAMRGARPVSFRQTVWVALSSS